MPISYNITVAKCSNSIQHLLSSVIQILDGNFRKSDNNNDDGFQLVLVGVPDCEKRGNN